MPKKKEEPEVTAAVETTESTAEVTDIEPVPVEPAAEVPAEPTKPAVEEPPKPKRTRKKKTDAVDEEALPEPQPAAPKEAAAKKKEAAAADRQNKPKTDPILTLEVSGARAAWPGQQGGGGQLQPARPYRRASTECPGWR